MSQATAAEVFKQIADLEKKIHELKLRVFFELPRTKRDSIYPEKEILKALKAARKEIWQNRYAKKVKGIS